MAFKAVADTVETTASVDCDPHRVEIRLPTDFEMPPNGLNIRWPDPPLVQENRLLHFKLYAALAYCRANRLNRIVIDSPNPRLGIITSGKSYPDVRQALDDLGIDEALAREIGIRLYKVGMIWPLEAEGVRRFAEGLDEILVVEEKRQFLEYQLKEELYNWREDVRPRVVGKFDEKGEWALIPTAHGCLEHGDWLLPAAGELTPAIIARAIALRIDRFFVSQRIRERLAFLDAKDRSLASRTFNIERVPTFCPGCPHNTSTRVPEGSRAMAGIGCHYLAVMMPDRNTATFSHMGGEGVAWVGQAPFTETRHVFANLGDGTYFHSGLLAIRQAVAAGVSMTYKILYNDAVAMTGGQPVDGRLSVPKIARQIEAEGVQTIVVVTDGTARDYSARDLPAGTPIRHRDELDAIQRELREVTGVSALIYDQTCAAEERRRRKRGTYPDPARRVFINQKVCEGCGDCGVQSNCMAVVPLETEFGRKRAIDQSICNKDYSCLTGFCPSFVTIEGGQPRKGKALADDESPFPPPPQPALPGTAKPFGILVTGVGGTGVVTIGALIGMAAHLDGRGVSVLDMTGLAQKGGAVYSHVRIADRPDDLYATRIAHGEADTVIGGDLVVSAGIECLSKVRHGHTRAVVNCSEIPTAEFARNPDWQFPQDKMQDAIQTAVGAEACDFFDAQALATGLLGDAIATNLFLLGYAWQKGLVPVTLASIEQAIALNASAVEMNRTALLWGRRAAVGLEAVRRFAEPAAVIPIRPPTLDELVARRAEFLVDYQDAAYAQRYSALVQRVREAELPLASSELGSAVARGYFKLLAYKDEYEVARLYCDPAFWDELTASFEGEFEVRFQLAPPLLGRPDPDTGRIAKRSYSRRMLWVFRILARLRRLRGTRWDPFGYTADRKLERALIDEYERDIARITGELTPARLAIAVEIASLPEQIRGFGHIKHEAASKAARRRDELWADWQRTAQSAPASAHAGGTC